jgi:hypothetical protein
MNIQAEDGIRIRGAVVRNVPARIIHAQTTQPLESAFVNVCSPWILNSVYVPKNGLRYTGCRPYVCTHLVNCRITFFSVFTDFAFPITYLSFGTRKWKIRRKSRPNFARYVAGTTARHELVGGGKLGKARGAP